MYKVRDTRYYSENQSLSDQIIIILIQNGFQSLLSKESSVLSCPQISPQGPQPGPSMQHLIYPYILLTSGSTSSGAVLRSKLVDGRCQVQTPDRLSTQPFGVFCDFLQNSCKYGLEFYKMTPVEGTSPYILKSHMLTIDLNPTTLPNSVISQLLDFQHDFMYLQITTIATQIIYNLIHEKCFDT